MVTTSTQSVEYDGAYRVDAIAKNGHKFVVYSRGYKLKSWLQFEKSMGSAVEYTAVSEEEFQNNQWYSQPYEDETILTPKKVAKTAVKKIVKKPAAKKAIKKAVKKAVKKAAPKKTTKKVKK